jgi:hypothetical protein
MGTYKCTTGDATEVRAEKLVDGVGVLTVRNDCADPKAVFIYLTPTDARAFAADVLAAAGGATMTAREAADAFIANDRRGSFDPSLIRADRWRDWFAAHWPAATVKPDLTVAPAFDVEAVARELVGGLVTGFPTPYEVQSVAAILRRHAPAATGGGVTITGRELMEMLCEANNDISNWAHCSQSVRDRYDSVAEKIRARAVPADAPVADYEAAAVEFKKAWEMGYQCAKDEAADAPGWVSRPKGEASSLVVPRDLVPDGERRVFVEYINGGKGVCSADASTIWPSVARWSADGETWIERQPATPGGWTARDVEACVGQMVLIKRDNDEEVAVRLYTNTDAAWIASAFNVAGIARYYVVPTPERGA